MAGPAHEYLSTSCLHGEHAYCQSGTGSSGTIEWAKAPASCKFCGASCTCPCHGRIVTMAEHKAGNTVVLMGTIVEIQDNIAVVKIVRAIPPADTIIVRLGTLPDDSPSADEDRIHDAMTKAQHHPGRVITR